MWHCTTCDYEFIKKIKQMGLKNYHFIEWDSVTGFDFGDDLKEKLKKEFRSVQDVMLLNENQ